MEKEKGEKKMAKRKKAEKKVVRREQGKISKRKLGKR